MTRRTLQLRLNPDQTPAEERAEAAEGLVLNALANSRCIWAVYNRGSVLLEPLLLFREHGALFLIASTLVRDGQGPRDPKTGTFRLSGLNDLRVTEQAIGPSAVPPSDWADGRPTRVLVAIAGLLVAQARNR